MWKELVNGLPKVAGTLLVLQFPPTGNVDRAGFGSGPCVGLRVPFRLLPFEHICPINLKEKRTYAREKIMSWNALPYIVCFVRILCFPAADWAVKTLENIFRLWLVEGMKVFRPSQNSTFLIRFKQSLFLVLEWAWGSWDDETWTRWSISRIT